MSAWNLEMIDRLRKRSTHLKERIKNATGRKLTYDEAEVSALDYAIKHLTLCKGANNGERDASTPDDLGNRRNGNGDPGTALPADSQRGGYAGPEQS